MLEDKDVIKKEIKLEYVDIMGIDEISRSIRVLPRDRLLKRLNDQETKINFNLDRLNSLITDLESVKSNLESIKKIIENNKSGIEQAKDYIFIPNDAVSDSIKFDVVEFKRVDGGYLLYFNTIPKKDVMMMNDTHRVNLTCIENNVRKRLIVSDLTTYNEGDIEARKHINTHKKPKIRSIRL